MYAPRLRPGDTIGIISPSQILDPAKSARIAQVIERLGFRVLVGDNVTKDSDGYLASAAERAADLNQMVADDRVAMILFPGGDGAVELLPLIDYAAIQSHPKLFSSYSDATPILLTIHAQTGLTTYYGFGASEFRDLRYYDYVQFCSHFVEGYEATDFMSDSQWLTLHGGTAEGSLLGGYLGHVARLTASPRFHYDPGAKYLLFLEDSDYFSEVGVVNTDLSYIEQSAVMASVTGLVFGHYADELPPDLVSRLARFGTDHDLPVVYTDDFGHGTKHAIFPIGTTARLDADHQTLRFVDSQPDPPSSDGPAGHDRP